MTFLSVILIAYAAYEILSAFVSSFRNMRIRSRGAKGEKKVSQILRRELPSNEYTVIDDVMLLLDGIRTSQIDHVVVSPYGIFAVEVKNYSGTVTGTASESYWCQSHGNSRCSRYSPVLQSEGHVRALRKVLHDIFGELPIYPVVVFNPKTKLHVQSFSCMVTNWDSLPGYIRMYRKRVLSTSEVSSIIEDLHKSASAGNAYRGLHIANVQRIKRSAYAVRSNGMGTCPYCGSPLVVRHGRRGDFIGCSGYPRCHYTSDVC